MQDRIVKLMSCTNNTEADMIMNMLANDGIECFANNQNTSTMMSQYSGIMGMSVDIMINESDMAHARELLSLATHPELVCPKCNSKNITYTFGHSRFKKIFLIIVSILTVTPIGQLTKNARKCKDCGEKF